MSVINQVLQELDKRQALERQQAAEKTSILTAPLSRDDKDNIGSEVKSAQHSPVNTEFVRPQVAFQSQFNETSAGLGPEKSTLRLVVITALLLLLVTGVWMLRQSEPELGRAELGKAEPSTVATDPLDSTQFEPVAITEAAPETALKAITEAAPEVKITALEAKRVESVAREDLAIEHLNLDSSDPKNSAQASQLPAATVQAEPATSAPQAAQIQELVLAVDVTEADVANTSSSMAVTEVVLTPVQRVNKLLLEAQSSQDRGRLQDAMEAYRQVLMLAPGQDEARKKLTALHYGQGEYAQALALMDSGIAQSGTQWEWYLIKAKIQQAQGDMQAALVTLHLVSDKSLWAKEKWAAQGDIGQKTGDYALAVSAYLRLSTQEPSKGLWWMGLAYAYDSKQNYKEASQAYRQALGASGLSQSAQAYITDRLVQLGESR